MGEVMKEIKKFGLVGGLLVMLLVGIYEGDINIGNISAQSQKVYHQKLLK